MSCCSTDRAIFFASITVLVSSTRAAESAKLLENISRCVNIALVNELKMIFERMNIDIWEVIRAASSKPFGFMPFYPGPGLGGHCIPIDPFYLTWKAREVDYSTKFIELAGEINTYMPYYVIDKMIAALHMADPEAAVLPYMMMGGTDNKHLASIGIAGYGFAPLKLPAGLNFSALFHGIDERVPIESLEVGTDVMEQFLLDC